MTRPVFSSRELIAVDWGTSNRRGYLLDKQGEISARRQDDQGLLKIENGAYRTAFNAFVADWCDSDGTRPSVLMSGMIGSRQGWAEAPYVTCPVIPADLARMVMAVPGVEEVWIIPGVCLDPDGERRDVMRGEEVQIFGAVQIAGCEDAVVCLPGTHSKWARVEGGKLVSFSTAMTGEVFDVMRRHSILGAMMDAGGGQDDGAFVRGLETASTPGGLLAHLFSVRADGLFERADGGQQVSYLSGLLIGHEIHDLARDILIDGEPVLLVSGGDLTRAYAVAFDALGIPFQAVEAEAATVRGIGAVWAARGGTTDGDRVFLDLDDRSG